MASLRSSIGVEGISKIPVGFNLDGMTPAGMTPAGKTGTDIENHGYSVVNGHEIYRYFWADITGKKPKAIVHISH